MPSVISNEVRKCFSSAASFSRKQSLSRSFFFQDNRFSWTDPGGEKYFIVAVAFRFADFRDHFGIELENFRSGLDALRVTLAFGSVHGDFHRLSQSKLHSKKSLHFAEDVLLVVDADIVALFSFGLWLPARGAFLVCLLKQGHQCLDVDAIFYPMESFLVLNSVAYVDEKIAIGVNERG
jgi:hypothetical protein